jgi:hypothetical protein
MKQVPFLRPTNFRHYGTKFSNSGTWCPGFECTLVYWYVERRLEGAGKNTR